MLETGSFGISCHVWHLSKTKFKRIKDHIAGAGARRPAAVGAAESRGAWEPQTRAGSGAAFKWSSRPFAAFVLTPVDGAVRGSASQAWPGT